MECGFSRAALEMLQRTGCDGVAIGRAFQTLDFPEVTHHLSSGEYLPSRPLGKIGLGFGNLEEAAVMVSRLEWKMRSQLAWYTKDFLRRQLFVSGSIKPGP